MTTTQILQHLINKLQTEVSKLEQTIGSTPETAVKVPSAPETKVPSAPAKRAVKPAKKTSKSELTHAQAINIASLVIPKRPKIPCLGMGLFDTDANAVTTITTTDEEIVTIVKIQHLMPPNSKFLADIGTIKKIMPITKANLNNGVVINDVTVRSLPLDECPPYAEYMNKGGDHELIDNEVVPLFKRCAFAMSKDESRYVLNGLCIESTNDGYNVIATDGKRLQLAGTKPFNIKSEVVRSWVVPDEVVNLVIKINSILPISQVKANNERINFVFGENAVILDGKLIEGTFPTWRNVVPDYTVNRKFSITVDRLQIADIAKATLKIKETPSPSIGFVGENYPLVQYYSGEMPLIMSDIKAKGLLSDYIFVDCKYISEALLNASGDTITIDNAGPNCPIQFTDGNTMHMLMPMRETSNMGENHKNQMKKIGFTPNVADCSQESSSDQKEASQ